MIAGQRKSSTRRPWSLLKTAAPRLSTYVIREQSRRIRLPPFNRERHSDSSKPEFSEAIHPSTLKEVHRLLRAVSVSRIMAHFDFHLVRRAKTIAELVLA